MPALVLMVPVPSWMVRADTGTAVNVSPVCSSTAPSWPPLATSSWDTAASSGASVADPQSSAFFPGYVRHVVEPEAQPWSSLQHTGSLPCGHGFERQARPAAWVLDVADACCGAELAVPSLQQAPNAFAEGGAGQACAMAWPLSWAPAQTICPQPVAYVPGDVATGAVSELALQGGAPFYGWQGAAAEARWVQGSHASQCGDRNCGAHSDCSTEASAISWQALRLRQRRRGRRPLRDPAPVVPLRLPRSHAVPGGRRSRRKAAMASAPAMLGPRGAVPAAGTFAAVVDRVRILSFDGSGCREVQLALQECSQDEAVQLAAELCGHVRRAIESPHANHVLQKFIETLPPTFCSFVPEELRGAGEAVARHRYGCRVLCRLVEHHSDKTAAAAALLQEVISGTLHLCRNEFGKHVLNALLEHGTAQQRSQIAMALDTNLINNAKHRSASYVVEHAIEHCCDADRNTLANHLLDQPQDVLALARSQAGCHVVRALVNPVHRFQQRVLQQLQELAPELQNSKYGKLLLQEMRIIPEEVPGRLTRSHRRGSAVPDERESRGA